MIVLAVNCGSSSLKFSLFDVDDQREVTLASGAVEGLGSGYTTTWVKDRGGMVERSGAIRSHSEAIDVAVRHLATAGFPAVAGVGHRLVFGGPTHHAPVRLDSNLVEQLRTMLPLAPLHLPAEIAGIEAVAALWPHVPQVGCFDTAFHQAMPERARRLALPRELWDAGIRRYGFHGLSYEYVVATIGAARLGRAVVAHLGHGVSLAAIANGASVDTTMGLTPTGGVMMSTRSGDLDPGVLIHLAATRGLDAGALERLVTREAGLLGVSAISGDMKTLLDRRASDAQAAQAVDMFCYHVRKAIGAMAAALGGLDTLVFTAGIGERSPAIRHEICDGLGHLGVRIDEEANQRNADVISPADGRPTVRVVVTNENLVVARATYRLLGGRP